MVFSTNKTECHDITEMLLKHKHLRFSLFIFKDNPSDFSYFFDTSRRRTCYIAPERFVEGGWKNADVGGQTGNLDITANNEVKAGELTPAMDIFAAG